MKNNDLIETESLNKKCNDDDNIKDERRIEDEKNECFSVFRGFLLAILSEFCLAMSNVFIKKTELFNDIEQALIRYLLQLVLMFSVIRFYKLRIVQSDRKTTYILILRGLLGTISILLTMRSLKLINPSDTIALVNLNVLFVAILARFVLPNERLSVLHLISIPITLLGVISLCKPTFLFSLAIKHDNRTNSTIEIDQTRTFFDYIMGISFGLLAGFIWATVIIIIRKLNLARVHYSISTIYTSFFAIPIALILFSIQIISNPAKLTDWKSVINSQTGLFIWQVVYMLIGAVCGILQIVLFNLALKYQDTQKIALIQPIDLVFGFVFQHFLLHIDPDIYGYIGATLIMTGVLIIIVFNYFSYLRSKRTKM